MAITYEITSTVREDLRERYEEYMIGEHIPDLMATGAFVSASIGRSDDGRYRIRYEAIDRKSLGDYLTEHADRLREHAMRAFPDGVQVIRDEWETIAVFIRDSEAE